MQRTDAPTSHSVTVQFDDDEKTCVQWLRDKYPSSIANTESAYELWSGLSDDYKRAYAMQGFSPPPKRGIAFDNSTYLKDRSVILGIQPPLACYAIEVYGAADLFADVRFTHRPFSTIFNKYM